MKASSVAFLFVTPSLCILFLPPIPGTDSVDCCLFMTLLITQLLKYVNYNNSISAFAYH